ncbi:hypothetical protein [Roseateles sp.]|uniref:hypothetical protein n=1 Tax=Roseateles sp. TaxID=1971397 RepID=UPI0039E9F093
MSWLLVGICLGNVWLALAGVFQVVSQAVVLAALVKASGEPPVDPDKAAQGA